MQLKTLVKVSTVNNLSDARYCAGMGVTMMGFSLDNTHTHYVSPAQFKAIMQWIEGVALVGELSATNTATICHALEQYTLDYLQVTYPIALPSIEHLTVPVVLKLTLQGNEQLASLRALMNTYAPYIKYFLLETISTHEAIMPSLQTTINCLANSFPILQGCYISTRNLPHLLHTKLQGIALSGGIETKPGYKDFSPLSDVLEYLNIE